MDANKLIRAIVESLDEEDLDYLRMKIDEKLFDAAVFPDKEPDSVVVAVDKKPTARKFKSTHDLCKDVDSDIVQLERAASLHPPKLLQKYETLVASWKSFYEAYEKQRFHY